MQGGFCEIFLLRAIFQKSQFSENLDVDQEELRQQSENKSRQPLLDHRQWGLRDSPDDTVWQRLSRGGGMTVLSDNVSAVGW